MLPLIQSIRKPPTPPSNRHGGRKPPRLTRGEIAALLEEEMDEPQFCPVRADGICPAKGCNCD